MATTSFPKPPKARQLRAAREAAGLSRHSAAALIYKSARAWEKWEQGERDMDAALWELWQLKVPTQAQRDIENTRLVDEERKRIKARLSSGG